MLLLHEVLCLADLLGGHPRGNTLLVEHRSLAMSGLCGQVAGRC